MSEKNVRAGRDVPVNKNFLNLTPVWGCVLDNSVLHHAHDFIAARSVTSYCGILVVAAIPEQTLIAIVRRDVVHCVPMGRQTRSTPISVQKFAICTSVYIFNRIVEPFQRSRTSHCQRVNLVQCVFGNVSAAALGFRFSLARTSHHASLSG